MAFITKQHLSRRTFLNGMGVTMALPLLESMLPAATALAQTAAKGRTRLACIYVPHGATMDKWTPATEGTGFELSEILQPLKPFRDRINIISDLSHPAGVRRRFGHLEPQPVGRDVPERRARGGSARGRTWASRSTSSRRSTSDRTRRCPRSS